MLLLSAVILMVTFTTATTTNDAVSMLSPVKENAFRVLEQVIAGVLSGRKLVFYLDSSVDTYFSRRLLDLPSVREKAHFVVDIGSDGSLWSESQSSGSIRGPDFIHVVVFENDPTPFFQVVSVDWNPKYLLLFSLVQGLSGGVLSDDAFQGIERLLLMKPLEPTWPFSLPSFGIYTSFPFANRSMELIEVWNPKKHFPDLKDFFVDRFPSFEGFVFHLATWFDDYPYLQPSSRPSGGDGLGVEMLDAMGSVFNFTYTMTEKASDDKWGFFENGSWNGLLGMVDRGEKHFTINYFGYTRERVKDFDASASYFMEGFGLAVLSPPPLAKWRGIYYPFVFNVWMGVGITFVLVVIVMTVQDCMQSKPFLGGFGQTWPYLLRAVVNHSMPTLPEAQWQRVFVGWWWLYCYLFTMAYTANLIAFLTIPVFPKRIHTVQELAESDHRVSMYDYGEFVPGALKSSEDPYYRTLGERLDLFPDDDTSMAPFLNGTHAYLESYSYSIVFIFHVYAVKNAYMLREQLYPGHLCWYFKKNTAWKYKFDYVIRQFVETGLVTYWMEMKIEGFLGIDYARKQRLAAEEQDLTALSISHVQGSFLILCFGWGVSALVFLAERFLARRRDDSDGKLSTDVMIRKLGIPNIGHLIQY